MEFNSQIFKPYRKIGSFCNDVGFCVESIGTKNYITTSIGNNFQTLDCKNLRLIAASTTFTDGIRLLVAAENQKIVCACANKIFVNFRGESIFPPFLCPAKIEIIVIVGEILLIYCADSEFISLRLPDLKKIFSINFSKTCAIKSICHPPAYVNKIVIGFENGALEIWDLFLCKSIKILKTYINLNFIKESPALDIIAIGANNFFHLHNIQNDTLLFSFNTHFCEISHISFLNPQFSFGAKNCSLVAISGQKGKILIFDLCEKKLISSIEPFSPKAKIAGFEFLNTGELIIAYTDNRINIYNFDINLQPKLLKFRSGISDQITKLRFVRDGGMSLIASYGNILRFINPNRDEQTVEFSSNKKIKEWKQKTRQIVNLGNIIDFDADAGKEYFWDNIVTCHKDTKWAHSWRLDNKSIGKKKIKLDILKNQNPTCVCITACCNSCILGYNHGALEIFNLQSSRHVGSFIDDECLSLGVLSVVADGRNIHIASIDEKYLRIWFYNTRKLKARIRLSFIPNKLDINRENSLISVAGNGRIIIIDLVTAGITREFEVDNATFSDICMSNDGRWLIAGVTQTSVDIYEKVNRINIWDLPSSKLIDCIETYKAISSLTLSHNKSLLAIAFDSDFSVTLLVNSMMYSNEVIQPINSEIALDSNKKSIRNENINEIECLSKLATLSLLPEFKWRYLDKIDLIMERSKAEDKENLVIDAPFFIPTIPGLKTVFDIEEPKPKKKRGKKQPPGVLLSKDVKNYTIENMTDFVEKLKKYSPAELDVQISLMVDSEEDLKKFLEILIDLLSTYQSLDFIEGIISLLLSIHSEKLMDPVYSEYLKKILSLTEQKWNILKNSCDQSLSVLGFIRSNVTNF